MAVQSRRDRVGLGLIGLGTSWERLYRETLLRLRNRLTVRLIYDPVEARAKSVAAEYDAEIANSLHQVLTRSTLQGLVILDPGWLGPGALSLIARFQKPVYLAGPAVRQTSMLRALLKSYPSATELSHDADELWMPEFGLRYTPSTCRLRELMVTRLGPVEQIVVDCDLSCPHAELAHVVDLCAHLIGKTPFHSSTHRVNSPARSRVDLEFPSLSESSRSRTAILQHCCEADLPPSFSIQCQKGTAYLKNRAEISWQTATESGHESLFDERSETEILIDQFCRRAMGGLNPVGRLSELLTALNVVESFTHNSD
jgi:predicted dehydrogenase